MSVETQNDIPGVVKAGVIVGVGAAFVAAGWVYREIVTMPERGYRPIDPTTGREEVNKPIPWNAMGEAALMYTLAGVSELVLKVDDAIKAGKWILDQANDVRLNIEKFIEQDRMIDQDPL